MAGVLRHGGETIPLTPVGAGLDWPAVALFPWPLFAWRCPMRTRVRVTLATPLELLELPGIGQQEAETILKYRAEHGPIRDAEQLAAILGGPPATFSERGGL